MYKAKIRKCPHCNTPHPSIGTELGSFVMENNHLYFLMTCAGDEDEDFIVPVAANINKRNEKVLRFVIPPNEPLEAEFVEYDINTIKAECLECNTQGLLKDFITFQKIKV